MLCVAYNPVNISPPKLIDMVHSKEANKTLPADIYMFYDEQP